MHKNVFPIMILISLILAGLVVLTPQSTPLAQESDKFDPVPGTRSVPDLEPDEPAVKTVNSGNISGYSEMAHNVPQWVRHERWFRSNAGGMALEETPSRNAALRNKYALVIDFTRREELPEYLTEYYIDNYFIEIRVLFEDGEETRRQWIFRDNSGTTRLIAVFTEPENDNAESVKNNEKITGNGFIEIFNENGFIISEYRFFDNGKKSRNEFNYNNGLVISASAMLWEENENGGEYAQIYIDHYRYNRSLFLRSVERVFYKDRQISPADEAVALSFPVNIMSAARIDNFISEKTNPYPEFFGEIPVQKESRIVFTTDEKGRVLVQAFHDEDDNVIWIIENIWQDDRIVSVTKTEDGIEYLAEYEYDSDGNRIIEINYKNGVLERLVKTTGNRDVENLYINNVVVLQAVWEDGRKISETRMR